MNFPNELKYSKTHEWVRALDNGNVCMGITDYAQKEMGVLVYVSLPQAGDAAVREKPLCEAESVKAVSEVYSPVTGVVERVNSELEDAPELVNNAPYDAWMVEIANPEGIDELMSADEYREYLDAEGNG